MTIPFSLVPATLLTPGTVVEYDASRAVQGLAVLPNRVLLIGSRLSTGSVAEDTLVQITRADDGIDFFGAHSQLARMCKVFKQNSKFTEVWAIALDDDGAGVAATKTITFTGTATSDGVIPLWIHGEKVNIPVTSGDTATVVGDTAVTQIGAMVSVMFTSANVTGTVTLTARSAGAWTEALDVRDQFELTPVERRALPAGITVAIADAVTGATNPDITSALGAVGDEYFTKYVCGFDDDTNVDALEAELLSRWDPNVQQDAMGYVGQCDTHANLLTYGAARNSQFTTVAGPGESPHPAAEWAAAYAAVDSNEPDPARPRQTLPVAGVKAPAREDRFTTSERGLLLGGGISTFKYDQAGAVSIERMVTTYQTNSFGDPDTTYRNVNTMHTLAALRYTTRVRFQTKYPRHKLSDNGTAAGAGQPVMTPRIAKAEYLSLFAAWEASGWVENAAQFEEELLTQRNASDRDRLDAVTAPDLMNQFRVHANLVQFIV